MTLTCSKCSRTNPPEAAYCYFDGNVLAGGARSATPLASQSFANPFHFPSGRVARTFDELAIACQEEWKGAKDLLQQGFLDTFFSGLGRADLAMAAREAARFPDADRGLDQLLSKIPSNALAPPKLRVEPQQVNLGTLPVGKDSKFELRLENQGMRLCYGSIAADDCLWLTIGEGAGSPEKLFQFGHETTLPIQVRGKHLRAGTKPLEGKLVVESNGGTQVVTVRVEVPTKPFPNGCLAGAKTPRQIAEKAKANPKEAAVLFEQGAVQRWYQDNGWTYPVQGPSASGIGAVQQFFEALGLTPPPKVEISDRSVTLQGGVGDQLRHVLTVSTPEKRPVYAHGSSDSAWVEVGRAKLNGRTATIPLVIPSVPNRPGETLTANVTVTSNGNQKFVVPVRLTIGAGGAFDFHAAPPAPAVAVVPEKVASAAVIAVPSAPEVSLPVMSMTAARRASRGGIGAGHLLPALLLALVLVAVLALDLIAPGRSVGGGGPRDTGSSTVTISEGAYQDLADSEPRIMTEFTDRARFGLLMLKERDPENPAKNKRLFYDEKGNSNNVCFKLEGQEHLFGQAPGVYLKNYKLTKHKDRYRWTSVMDYPEKVRLTQIVEILPNQQTRVLDTCLVRYTIENFSNSPRKVGLRVMLDTFIGANDGVPFRIPGESDFLKTMKVFGQKDIPDYVQAWENPDLKNPGTVAHLGLKNFEIPKANIEPILEMVICRFPNNTEQRWKWDYTPMNEPIGEKGDSCVVLYWEERTMNPGEKRDMAYSYGLNAISGISTGGSSGLGLTAGGSFRPGGQFTLTATLTNPTAGQKVTLELPGKGVALAPGEQATQTLDPRGAEQAQTAWKIKCQETGEFDLVVTSGALKSVYRVKITNRSLFD